MAKPSTISRLPDDVRREFEARLVAHGFADYSTLTDWLNEQGYEISRSAVGRAGLAVKNRLASIKAATDAAKMIAAEADDSEDSRSAGVMAMLQTDLFNVLLTLQQAEVADPEERVKLLGSASRAVADLSRASISQKKHAADVRANAAKIAAEAADEAAKKAGMSSEGVAFIRAAIMDSLAV